MDGLPWPWEINFTKSNSGTFLSNCSHSSRQNQNLGGVTKVFDLEATLMFTWSLTLRDRSRRESGGFMVSDEGGKGR